MSTLWSKYFLKPNKMAALSEEVFARKMFFWDLFLQMLNLNKICRVYFFWKESFKWYCISICVLCFASFVFVSYVEAYRTPALTSWKYKESCFTSEVNKKLLKFLRKFCGCYFCKSLETIFASLVTCKTKKNKKKKKKK